MKIKAKSLAIMGLFLLSTPVFSISSVISLKDQGKGIFGNEYLKTIKTGQSISYSFEDGRPHYVESILLSAIGKQSAYSFARVYADGREVALLGVPGRDPDYPIVIREKISKIEIVAQDASKIKLLRFDIFTERKNYSSYSGMTRGQRSGFGIEDWGGKVLELVTELQSLSSMDYQQTQQVGVLYGNENLKQLKITALQTQASANTRDVVSINTKRKAKQLASKLNALISEIISTDLILDPNYDGLILDLMTITEDIQEKYDIEIE